MNSFEDQAPKLVATAAEVASLRGSIVEAGILSAAKATFVQTGHDNWDGGIDIYALMLEVPIAIYADLEDQRSNVEKIILDRVQQLIRGYAGIAIGEVVISPLLLDPIRAPAATDESEQIGSTRKELEPTPAYWQSGHFRLFVSHASHKRGSAHRLKEALAPYQIAAFVAHDDIEPTKEWQVEIETALRTMDSLVALISPEFVVSKWCDQEVGIAIGRNKLVVPLRVGSDPHGFLGKYQGLQTAEKEAPAIALQLFEILLKNEMTCARLADSLVDRMVASTTWASAKATMVNLAKVKTLSTNQAGRLLHALESNPQVSGANGVPEQIRSLIAQNVKISAGFYN
jgi:hypothetical protein